jgi:murein DD-endopeptidase MepM/ murein hydrolase activator NlpD
MGARAPRVSPTWPDGARTGIPGRVELGATRRRVSARAQRGRVLLFAAAFAGSIAAPGCSGSEGSLAEHKLLLPLELPTLPDVAAPELAKKEPEKLPPWAPEAPAMHHVLAVDHGIRSDRGGKGHFLAPRAHGKHNGIDYLAPVGTPVLAACSGKAKSDERGGYGRVVQLVCELPDVVDGPEGLHASFFYAHLDKAVVPKRWTQVKLGDKLGTVGKTGNAAGPKIMPHLHL